MRIDRAGWTHVGRRADGLGGYEGGEVASRCVVDSFAGFCERVTHGPEATWPHRTSPRWWWM